MEFYIHLRVIKKRDITFENGILSLVRAKPDRSAKKEIY